MEYFVGIDWGTQIHRVAVLDGNGRVIEQYNADHSGEGLVALVLAWHAVRRLGGITGDVLGALVETATAACLIVTAMS